MAGKEEEEAFVEDRRRFLKTCGRFAVVTPPTITLLLTGPQNYAVAGSGTSGGVLVSCSESPS